MLLPRKLAFFAILSVIACREPTSPRVARVYVLESVDGQAVPATVYTSPAGSATIVFATVALDVDGIASSTEGWRYSHLLNPIEEATLTFNNEYKIAGHNISIGPFEPCDPAAVCAQGPRFGKITATTLTLAHADNPSAPVFLYRIQPSL
jgi:hypothetical protein